jgi:hypothetical protein
VGIKILSSPFLGSVALLVRPLFFIYFLYLFISMLWERIKTLEGTILPSTTRGGLPTRPQFSIDAATVVPKVAATPSYLN